MTTRTLFLSLALSAVAATPARAALFALTVDGTISINSSGDGTIPVGTPWTFELVYDTAAPDLDFETAGSPDPSFGRFTNTGVPPALISFHYRAGDYEVTIGEPAAFGTFSAVDVTFTSVHAIDINIHAPAAFPHLSGGEVSFHADFNDFSSRPIFQSDALPSDPALDLGDFDMSTVSLLPAAGGEVTSTALTSLAVAPAPEPSRSTLALASLLVLLGTAASQGRVGAASARPLSGSGAHVWVGPNDQTNPASHEASVQPNTTEQTAIATVRGCPRPTAMITGSG